MVTIPPERTFAQNETETYENDEFGFAFEHPSNWKVEEPSPNEITLVPTTSHYRDEFALEP